MDDIRFDALTRSLASPAPRRRALRLVTAGLLAALLPGRAARAQRQDSDGDGLFDDDEIVMHGTDPNNPDTDGDGTGDGAELAAGTNPRAIDPPAPTCTGFGGSCTAQSNCCGYEGSGVLCCFDANGAGTCTDVSVRGFTCPDPGVPDTGCAVGMTNCGGFCTNLATDHGNCGSCGNRCSQVGEGYNCVNAHCEFYCASGLVDCGGYCADLQTDFRSCGACGNHCGIGTYGAGECVGGVCHYPTDF